MEKYIPPFSIKVFYWLTQVLFWMFIAVFVLATGVSIAMFNGWLGDDLQLHAGLPVEIYYTEKGLLELGDVHQELEFKEAIGKIHFIDTKAEIARWFVVALMGAVIISLYIFIMFKRFITNVYKGLVFERFNIRMLQNISYGLVALWLFTISYGVLYYHFIAKYIEFEHLEVSSKFNYNGEILMVALFLWVLSHIFMSGVRIKDEQQLTI